ncbi:hypothetical protein [Candidatus Methylobacter favarea]|uniref:hypothetical protein n=1 Tax=Candidatus Methylobacter favarea TaxID=2707345 RepID=UPI00157BC01D|nr:hypothetical protein [Candidatus Methylobacter favarea]
MQASDRLLRQGQTLVEVAKRFAASTSFFEKLQQQRRERGTLEPNPHGGGHQFRLARAPDKTRRPMLFTKPDTTLAELGEKLGVNVHQSALWDRLQRLGLTFKNTDSGRAGVRGRLAPSRLNGSDGDLRGDGWRLHTVLAGSIGSRQRACLERIRFHATRRWRGIAPFIKRWLFHTGSNNRQKALIRKKFPLSCP